MEKHYYLNRIESLEKQARKMSRMVGFLTGTLKVAIDQVKDENVKRMLEKNLEKSEAAWSLLYDATVSPEEII